ncbi:prepilin peptidase-dependent protein [Klebsiella sp. I138]|uniref:prepilin peptidase-dependent protein n=1 Tax=Klebsiella sp. I138 TaxID=2755385 RepID=UPI003DA8485B
MNRQRGYTLIETLIALALILILSTSGLYGWQRWQQQQRLWQTAGQVRDYLVLLRDDANWHNRNRLVRVGQRDGSWCLSAADEPTGCAPVTPFTLHPRWPEVALSHITPGLGFYGVRNSAWAGHIRLQSAGGSWNIIVSDWGRIRLCRNEETASCL